MKIFKNLTFFSALLCALVGLYAPSASAATTCQPEASWRHPGCTAHGIQAPAPTVTGTLWRSHEIQLSIGAITDKDHCCVNGPYVDYSEDNFTYEWKIQVPQGNNWVDYGAIGGNAATVTWDTSAYDPGTYRVTLKIDDTPGTGNAKGNDTPVTRETGTLELKAPQATNFRQTGSWTRTMGISFTYAWDSTCGEGEEHIAHLANVTVRENVTYEPGHDFTGPDGKTRHRASHADPAGNNPTNSFDPVRAIPFNPTLLGVSGSDGEFLDEHDFLLVVTPIHASLCIGTQNYQQAYRYPNAPSAEDADPPIATAIWSKWANLAGPLSLTRRIEAVEGNWVQRISKPNLNPEPGNTENTAILAPIP